MFSQYRDRMQTLGPGIREANKRQSEQIMNFGFSDSQSYRKVIIDGKEYDARIISDSKTTVRGGNGNYVIQFKNDFYLKAGTYIQIPDAKGDYEWWLSLYESDATLFPKHIIKKCNYLLKWKNSVGEIIERWCVFNDNTKLMDAERKSNFNKLTLSYYINSLLLPCDSETINIRIDKRFIVDHAHVIDNPDAWIVTNRNVISKRFDDYDGVIELAISKHQFNHNVDSKEHMIADYYTDIDKVEGVDDTASFDCRITYNGTSDLKMGTPFKHYLAEVYCNGKLDTSIPIKWSVAINDIDGTFKDNVNYEVDGNTLKIKCKFNNDLLNSHIRLIAKNEELGVSAELPVKVVGIL